MIRLKDHDAQQVATALEGLASTIRQTNEVPASSFQVNTEGVRMELKVIPNASTVHSCGTCRGFRRGQGVVGYCDDPRSPRKDTVVPPESKPCQSYERVHNGI